MQDDINLALAKLIATHDVKAQCSELTAWLKQRYPLEGIGFFLKDAESTRAHFFTENVPKRIVQNLEELLLDSGRRVAEETDVLFFADKAGELVAFGRHDAPGELNPMGIAIPLGFMDHSAGTLVLISDPSTIQDITAETTRQPSLISVIAGLLVNAVSHEHKDNKIRMLNLYQSVSASLAYIGDLQELLTTITGIVTSELFCEECSVLLYDEESDEFEFFTAFGETGMALVSERFPADKGIAGRALRERTTQVVNDCQSDPDFYCTIDEDHDFKTRSILAAPLIAGEEPVGVLNAINKVEDRFFDKEDDQILSAIADEVAMAVKNAKLFDFVVDSYCKIRQGLNSCKDCKRPLKSWTPCARQLDLL